MGCNSSLPQDGADLTPFQLLEEDGNETEHIVVMVNGKSGGNKAKAILDLNLESYRLNERTWVWIYNLFDVEGRKTAMEQLKQFQDNSKTSPRVVACGGDGTVKWVISLLEANDCLKVPVGVIPFGTGNDFSRVCGWGGFTPKPLIGKHMCAFNRTVKNLSLSETHMFDVWKIEILLKNNGKFLTVKDKKEVLCEKETNEKVMVHEMINYFSIGADASIVFEFEKNRKNTQLKNKVEYAKQGTKQLVSAPAKLQKYIGKIQSNETEIDAKLGRKFLVWQNIGSYGGGMDIWAIKKPKNNGLMPQDFGDHKLELMSVMGTQYVPLSKGTGGAGIGKVAQVDNYSVSFKDDWENPVYFQVDGEGIKAYGVREVSISHRYEVKVLVKDGNNIKVSKSL
uniref:Diacylglycerol kinase n=1 Tax=Aplanochytrium stocchinoi TaxID=215587 RepID=A0A7S3PR27_9STRA|mmetsp:Transcript_5871/g.7400  ORF Transcript_5871/g.7400 Transcript_5871/m.7400 type:complete len:395 (-) Transcript_5871:304-1488(-)|eukprot:CAMPEP_0204830272 /NCGR_PEP_ID=MMETSP1346-20131115/8436_1 /ASSEMBLY_ACC=CAM_ASM_000771 /TAXON_ID=215587 /ORGANISM="Aplanochytrium stocchinoi, Strain GSBS06" /LENGTH=394 /DNA_ID=CAMNT_0051960435 /DNA_START=397 /DNA_END=1581 /DNA_ORIENTATION=-